MKQLAAVRRGDPRRYIAPYPERNPSAGTVPKTVIPMAGSIKSILNAVVVIVVVLWLLNVFGILDSIATVHVRG